VAQEIEFTPDPTLGLGTWSNAFRVMLGTQQVTIDFAVRDPLDAGRADLIVRVNLPTGTAFDLRDELINVMQEYSERGQPPQG
jgi:hypothetical protein